MSSKQKRLKDRQLLLEMWDAIEPAKNEEIARKAIDVAHQYLIVAENQANHISALEKRNSRMQGHWIDTGSGQECSVCGEFQPGYDNHRYYCQNCGAKMIKINE